MRTQFIVGKSMTVAIADTPARVALPEGGSTLRLVNDSAKRVWVHAGDAACNAEREGCMLLTPGYTAFLRMPDNATHLSFVGEGKNQGTLNITMGAGG